jgi:hypothetical protein
VDLQSPRPANAWHPRDDEHHDTKNATSDQYDHNNDSNDDVVNSAVLRDTDGGLHSVEVLQGSRYAVLREARLLGTVHVGLQTGLVYWRHATLDVQWLRTAYAR